MKTLITFGDSWPQGGELKEPLGQYPYGRQLADQYGYKFFNYGSPGASNEDMVLQLLEFYIVLSQMMILLFLCNLFFH